MAPGHGTTGRQNFGIQLEVTSSPTAVNRRLEELEMIQVGKASGGRAAPRSVLRALGTC